LREYEGSVVVVLCTAPYFEPRKEVIIMKPKKFEKIKFLERMLIDATFLKNEENCRRWMDVLHRHGCHEGIAMEAAKRFLRESQTNQN